MVIRSDSEEPLVDSHPVKVLPLKVLPPGYAMGAAPTENMCISS
jgi:hypothetical protein